MLQTRFNIKNDPCDETILALTALLNMLACIVETFADEEKANACKTLTDCVNAAVCSCLLTQQDLEIKRIEEDLESSPYQGMNQLVLEALPPEQQEMIQGFPIKPKKGSQYGAAGPVAEGAPAV